MALLKTIVAEDMQATTQDETNAEIVLALTNHETDLAAIKADYVTSVNVGEKFRGSLPKFWNMAEINYNDLTFGDHLLWDFATGITNAPPVQTPQWMFVEMIRTYPYPPNSPLADNAVQRAWGYKQGFMATRSRYQNTWSPWVVMDVVATP